MADQSNLAIVTTLQQLVQAQSKIQQTLAGATLVLPVTSYATGTWAPALAFGGASTGIAYGTQLGTYTQVGREVICRFALTLTAVGSATGAATITGLPFPSNSNTTNVGAGGHSSNYSAMSGLVGSPFFQVGANSSILSLLQFGATGAVAVTNSNFTNTSTIDGFFSYFI